MGNNQDKTGEEPTHQVSLERTTTVNLRFVNNMYTDIIYVGLSLLDENVCIRT